MFEKDESLTERGKAIAALEDFLGDGRLVNNPEEAVLHIDSFDVRRVWITMGGPNIWIDLNLSRMTGEYSSCEGLGKPRIDVPLTRDQVERLCLALCLEEEL